MKKKYCLRGGMIGFAISVIVGLVLLFSPIKCLGECKSLYWFDAFHRNISEMIGGGAPSQITVTYLFVFTMLGIFFGWLYGKIKN